MQIYYDAAFPLSLDLNNASNKYRRARGFKFGAAVDSPYFRDERQYLPAVLTKVYRAKVASKWVRRNKEFGKKRVNVDTIYI